MVPSQEIYYLLQLQFKTMFKASDILKSTRIDKDYDLKEISKKTKIPQKYLQAIEDGDIKNYPAEPYCSLFVSRYSSFLGLDVNKTTSLFRRDMNLKTDNFKLSKKQSIYLTPQFLFTISISLVLILMFSFLIGRYLSFNKPPKLTVNWPDKVSSPEIRITGTTDPNSSVRVNDDLIIIDQDGNFSKQIDISQTPLVIIEARSPYGKKTVLEKNFSQIDFD